MFRKYFQGAGDDDDEPPGFGPEPSDPGTTPEELWGKVRAKDSCRYTYSKGMDKL
jgi:hypothetical protein